jgi:hypothetical protein
MSPISYFLLFEKDTGGHCKSVSDMDHQDGFSLSLCIDKEHSGVGEMSEAPSVVPINSGKYLCLHFFAFEVVSLQTITNKVIFWN